MPVARVPLDVGGLCLCRVVVSPGIPGIADHTFPSRSNQFHQLLDGLRWAVQIPNRAIGPVVVDRGGQCLPHSYNLGSLESADFSPLTWR